MATTNWMKTLSNHQLIYPYNYAAGMTVPNPTVMSGDGTVFYFSIGESSTSLARYKYANAEWTYENFIGTPDYSVTGTKQLPNSAYACPIATSEDGNTLVLIKSGYAQYTTPRKIIIVSYSNGGFVQVGSEITFTKQSNFSLESNNQNNYYILKVLISDDASKMVVITHGGINTLVFSNGSWNLLPSSPDILPSDFPYDGFGSIPFAANMSRNGMYLTLSKNNLLGINVFKFDTQLNNWVLLKLINNVSVEQTFVSNTGVVIFIYSNILYRYEYNLTTTNYELILKINGTNIFNPIFGNWDQSRIFMSADCNTILSRYRYLGMNVAGQPADMPMQLYRMLKWKNGNWELVELPSSLFPYIAGNQDSGSPEKLLGMSSDGRTFITTPNLANQYWQSSIINVYYNPPPPTLSLGDMISIKETDVSFNNANVFVKNPTVALNVSNKQYVDVADEEINTLILASASNYTTSTTEYNDLIAQRQTVQSTLAIQIDQLYQYFFNQSRANATLFYTILTSPLAFDGCSLWLDSADSSSVIRSGTNVSAWNDKSSRGYTFTQTDSSKQPIYTPNALDGKSTISFSDDFLSGASGFELGRNSISMFVVCEMQSTTNSFVLAKFGYPNVNDGNIRVGLGGGMITTWAKHHNAGLNESAVIGNEIINGYVMLECVVNRVEGRDVIYLNGTIPLNNNAWNSSVKTYASDISYNITNSFDMILGGSYNFYTEQNVPISGLVGHIAEVVAYLNPYDLTDSKRYQIEGYLAHKWGLESKLPSNHPFKTATYTRL